MNPSKNILITGASRGIGQAIARQAAQQGWSIGLNYNQSQSQALSLAEELRQMGVKVVCLQADVSQQSEVQRMFREFDEALGPLHALVNNAGVGLATLVDAASTAAMLDTNLRGPMRVSSAFLPLLKAGGRVVNVGSGSGPTYVKALIEGGGQVADLAALALQRQTAAMGDAVQQRQGLMPTGQHQGCGLVDHAALRI